MAHPKAAAYPAHVHPARIVDALGDIECHFLAFEVIEQLLSPQKAPCTEDLAHVDRAGLGWLFTVLNVAMRQQIEAAQALAEEAYQFQKSTHQGT